MTMKTDGDTIWLEIKLGAIRRNIRRIQSHTGRPVMAVVKANAYGHGIMEVARAAEKAGSSFLCVARIEEARKIRNGGIKIPILVMGFTKPEMVVEAIQNNISLTISDIATLEYYIEASKNAGKQLKVHAKIDSGMGRLGVLTDLGLDFCVKIARADHLYFEGIFTHFARADELQAKTTEEQITRFNELLVRIDKSGIKPGIIHAANSAASLYFPSSWYDAVRPGLAIYGMDPSPEAPIPEEFERALEWKCVLGSVKKLPKGSGVGYGHHYFTAENELIGVAAAGYADGFRRWQDNIALLRGKRIQQAGTICMDQSQWRLENVPDAEVGDEVVLIGRQGSEKITAEEVAKGWGTINYEVVCGLTDRVRRIFIEDED